MTGAVLCCLAACFHAAAPNVVLLTIDTLRADRLGCYGYALPTTPHLDAFAATGMLFEDCECEVPITAPSLSAMLTSRCPRETGLTRNGLGLPEAVPTVAEAFRAAGYHTFCVQSNWTLKAKLAKLDRGFDVYEDDFRKRRWGFLLSERSGEEVTEVALRLLEERPKDKPYFAWIHYSDPHAPYKMHQGFNPCGKGGWNIGKEERIQRKYDSEVAYADAEAGKLLAALPPDTSVLFVADHGESLFEHDYLGHGRRLYRHETRVPLIVRMPGLEPSRSALPVRGLDIAPTLLGMAGLPKGAGMRGSDLVHDAIPPDRVRVIETYGGAVPKLPGAKALLSSHGPLRQAALQGPWKLIVDDGKRELFHENDDPGELENRAAAEPALCGTLNGLIELFNQKIPRKSSEERVLEKEDAQALDALGYLN